MGHKVFIATSVIMLAIAAVALYSWRMAEWQPDAQQTVILGRTQYASDSPAGLTLQVRNAADSKPIAGARVKLSLLDSSDRRTELTQTSTDGNGRAQAGWRMPKLRDGNYRLCIAADSAFGSDQEEFAVEVKRQLKILVNTDKPIYQPGQTVHIRALAMERFHMRPAGELGMTIEVNDPQGNKVFKQQPKSSAFGIVAADFVLASEVNEGAYRVKVSSGQHSEEKEITVKHYVLPKFKVATTFDKNYYLPGEEVRGTLDGNYFFGKPVAGGKVELVASAFDVEFVQFLQQQGLTDDSGHYTFAFALPSKLYGSSLQKGNALVKVDCKLTDTAGHSETITRSLTVAPAPLLIVAIPASRNWVVGIANTVYLATVYADGTPAVTTIEVGDGANSARQLKTNELGLAEIAIVPDQHGYRLAATAQDARGIRVRQTIDLRAAANNAQGDFFTVLDKPCYRVGDTVQVRVVSARSGGNYYLDVVKDRQTVLTRIVETRDGKCETSFQVTPELCGTLLVDVYHLGQSSEIMRDTRTIFVAAANDIEIAAQLSRDSYRPGDEAQIDFTVTDKQGNLQQAALSLSIVDEAVFFLQEMQPGLEKVYFMLHKELLTPQYQIRYGPPVSPFEVVTLATDPAAPSAGAQQAREQATRVMFAIAQQAPQAHVIRDSLPAKKQRIDEIKEDYFRNLWTAISAMPFVLLLASGLWLLSILALKWRRQRDSYYTGEQMTQPAARHLQQFQFGFWLTLLFPFALVLSLVCFSLFIDYRSSRLATLCFLPFPLLLFTVMLAWQKGGKVALSRPYLLAGIVISVATLLVVAAEENRWQIAERMAMTLLWLFGLGLAKSFLHSLWYGILYVHGQQRLPFAGAAVVALLSFVFLYLSSMGVLIGIDNNYDWRHAIDRNIIEPLSVLALIGGIAVVPVMSLVLLQGFFSRLRIGKLFAYGGTVFAAGIILFVLLLPTLGSVQEKAGRARPMAGATFDEQFALGNGHVAAIKSKGERQQTTGEAPAVRVREHFPETLYWNPQLIADNGKASIRLPVSDAITTFRMVCQGVTRNGALGSMSKGLRVFQDFFVDIDFPVALTQHDEVSVPVQVYNYLPQPQQVRLVVTPEDWFTLLSPVEQVVTLAANSVSAVHFRLRAMRPGERLLTVHAYGESMNDAIKRRVTITPDGEKQEVVINANLDGSREHTLTVPPEAVPEASKVLVKCYPGIGAVLVEGLEGMLRMPGG